MIQELSTRVSTKWSFVELRASFKFQEQHLENNILIGLNLAIINWRMRLLCSYDKKLKTPQLLPANVNRLNLSYFSFKELNVLLSAKDLYR